MNKKIVFFVVFVFIISTITCSARASYYYDDGANNDNPNIDKFKPTSGVKIKESNIAGWMENATKNAMNGNKNKNQKSNYTQQQTKNNKMTGKYKKSYKWF